MSQFFIQDNGGSPPPPGTVGFLSGQVGVNPVGPDGSNNINVFAEFINDSVDNGIQTRGDAATNTVYVQLTNRLQGSVTTAGNVTSTAASFALPATPGTYLFNCDIVAFASSVPASAGFSTYTTIRTDGATATVIDDTDAISHKSFALALANAFMDTTGNTVRIRVKGVNLLNVNWNAVGTYVRVL